jgi:hypothetical protein
MTSSPAPGPAACWRPPPRRTPRSTAASSPSRARGPNSAGGTGPGRVPT